MRDTGNIIKQWPATFGSDAAGVIVEAGAEVMGVLAEKGTRVAAFCPYFATSDSDRGAFQKFVIIPQEYIAPIPRWCSFIEAAKLPMAVLTAWNGWNTLGLPYEHPHQLQDKKGVLVWGGSSSVGSVTVQVAKLLGYHVYTTASYNHHMYLKSIGATHVFDRKNPAVVEEIIAAIKADGVSLDFAYDAVGSAAECNAVIKAINPTGTTKMAYAPLVTDETARTEGVELCFITPPKDDAAQRKWATFIFNTWLARVLEERTFKPSPPPKLIKPLLQINTGLKSLDEGLDELKKGVSGNKLVIEVYTPL
jgi:D-arabinose 1-dehydrogenase-like Zn-dependent alcohol dehydrogenase